MTSAAAAQEICTPDLCASASLPLKASTGKWLARWMSEGQGARVKRTIGALPNLEDIDPFLMLDEFFVSKESGAGFPNHPHRGFQTVTLMVEGAFRHTDNHGRTGVISAGDVQYMTAGRGVIHSEMPEASGVSHGLQLWVNLKARDKMCPPNYQDLKSADIPVAKPEDGLSIRVIAGQAYAVRAPTVTLQPVTFLEVHMRAGKRFEQPIPKNWNSFVYILTGKGVFSATEAGEGTLVRFARKEDAEEAIRVECTEDMHFALLAGEPTDEPVAKHGPFVMNTRAEIAQAFEDYSMGRFASDTPTA